MAEIIEKQELPVTITKIKIGTKDLSKNILAQLPYSMFLYHYNYLDINKKCYGFPISNKVGTSDLEIDQEKDYIIDGKLLGYIRMSFWDINQIESWIKRHNNDYWGKHSKSLDNYDGKFYFIVWHNDGKLKKGYIDQWSLKQLNIEIENLQIFI